MKRLLGGLLVLVVLLVGADVAARIAAQRELASTLQARLELDEKPNVSIRGFSVLIQAVTGTYDEVEVTAKGVPTDNIGMLDYDLTFYDIDLPLSDVISHDIGTVTAGSADAAVAMTEDALSDLVGQPVTVTSGDGESIVLATTYQIAGASVDLTITGSVTADDKQVYVEIEDVTAQAGDLPKAALSEISDALNITFPLPPAIRGMTLTGITADDGAVVLHAEGTDVPLSE